MWIWLNSSNWTYINYMSKWYSKQHKTDINTHFVYTNKSRYDLYCNKPPKVPTSKYFTNTKCITSELWEKAIIGSRGQASKHNTLFLPPSPTVQWWKIDEIWAELTICGRTTLVCLTKGLCTVCHGLFLPYYQPSLGYCGTNLGLGW